MSKRFIVAALSSFFFAVSSYAYRTAAWIAPWDPSSLTSVQMNGGVLQESNPVWYSWTADGSIAKNWNAENPTWRAAMTGTQLIPTIQNIVNGSYSGSAAATVLGDAARREAHASAIAQLVIANAYDGIDIDYERVPTTSRAAFTAFVQSLGQKLHAVNKQLSVTVYAKTSDKQNWNGPGPQDWAALAQVADTVKIMAYDYHWDGSDAGPLTPLDWLDQVATYAESVIPAQKIIMGLPWYGYDWVGTSGATVTYDEAMKLAQSNGATIAHDANGEATFTYGTHTVFFQDADSYFRKFVLLREKHPSIGGFAHWCAGQEDARVWNVLKNGTLTDGAAAGVPATPAPSDFAVTGPALLPVVQGQDATAEFRLVAINGFKSTAAISVTPLSNIALTAAASAPAVGTQAPVQVRFSIGRETAPGTYEVSVRFTSGSITHERRVSLVVSAAAPAKRRSVGH